MGFFTNQLSNVVEWQEYRDDVIFWKWDNDEIKKGSKLIIRQGQDAIFMYNGKIEGIFSNEGRFDIESQIIPFLSTLKGFKFGFNSGLRSEVLFVNTKEFIVKWGTKSPINLQTPVLPGGMPVRANGTFTFKVSDYTILIEKIAGVKRQYTVDDVRERVSSMLNPLLMKWIMREGKDMFNIQANAYDIGKGIAQDMDMELEKIGLSVTTFNIQDVSYPEEVAKMQQKAAAQAMVGDVNKYTQMAMADAMAKGGSSANTASQMAQMQMGMMWGQQMANQMQMNNPQNMYQQNTYQQSSPSGSAPKFCPECGTPTNGAKFCSNCGKKLI